MNDSNPILCLDFDGVIHSYTSGWKGIDVISDPPVDGAIKSLYEYIEHFKVCIFSTRNSSPEGIRAMREWLSKWDADYWKDKRYQPRTALVLCIEFPTEKPSAFVGIDDRILTFEGKFPSVKTLINFKPWNKK